MPQNFLNEIFMGLKMLKMRYFNSAQARDKRQVSKRMLYAMPQNFLNEKIKETLRGYACANARLIFMGLEIYLYV